MTKNRTKMTERERDALEAMNNMLMRDPEYLEAVKDARSDGSCIGYGRYAGRCDNLVTDHNLYCQRCNAARWAAIRKREREDISGRPNIINPPAAMREKELEQS